MKDTRLYFASAIVLLLSGVWAVWSILETNLLNDLYIFSPEQLQAISTYSINQHGNYTKALVANIVDQLRSDPSIAPHLAVKEEWMFNNAGGAMGAMYIIHASASLSPRGASSVTN